MQAEDGLEVVRARGSDLALTACGEAVGVGLGREDHLLPQLLPLIGGRGSGGVVPAVDVGGRLGVRQTTTRHRARLHLQAESLRLPVLVHHACLEAELLRALEAAVVVLGLAGLPRAPRAAAAAAGAVAAQGWCRVKASVQGSSTSGDGVGRFELVLRELGGREGGLLQGHGRQAAAEVVLRQRREGAGGGEGERLGGVAAGETAAEAEEAGHAVGLGGLALQAGDAGGDRRVAAGLVLAAADLLGVVGRGGEEPVVGAGAAVAHAPVREARQLAARLPAFVLAAAPLPRGQEVVDQRRLARHLGAEPRLAARGPTPGAVADPIRVHVLAVGRACEVGAFRDRRGQLHGVDEDLARDDDGLVALRRRGLLAENAQAAHGGADSEGAVDAGKDDGCGGWLLQLRLDRVGVGPEVFDRDLDFDCLLSLRAPVPEEAEPAVEIVPARNALHLVGNLPRRCGSWRSGRRRLCRRRRLRGARHQLSELLLRALGVAGLLRLELAVAAVAAKELVDGAPMLRAAIAVCELDPRLRHAVGDLLVLLVRLHLFISICVVGAPGAFEGHDDLVVVQAHRS
mmetsp:Transcript_55750/g.141795  ORF Transcript_55750/g.141795 Transcript_55750/m.141795 type:complete len:571 (-) Transcript_55750:617-2329(-)